MTRLISSSRDRLKRYASGTSVLLKSRKLVMTLAAAGMLTAAGCGPSATLRNQDTQVKADPFAVLDEQQKLGKIDPALIEERLDAARQQWLRALAAQQRNDKAATV